MPGWETGSPIQVGEKQALEICPKYKQLPRTQGSGNRLVRSLISFIQQIFEYLVGAGN